MSVLLHSNRLAVVGWTTIQLGTDSNQFSEGPNWLPVGPIQGLGGCCPYQLF